MVTQILILSIYTDLILFSVVTGTILMATCDTPRARIPFIDLVVPRCLFLCRVMSCSIHLDVYFVMWYWLGLYN